MRPDDDEIRAVCTSHGYPELAEVAIAEGMTAEQARDLLNKQMAFDKDVDDVGHEVTKPEDWS